VGVPIANRIDFIAADFLDRITESNCVSYPRLSSLELIPKANSLADGLTGRHIALEMVKG